MCVGHQKKHDDGKWKYMDYRDTQGTKRVGWFCHEFFTGTPVDLVPDRIKQDRIKYARETLQPFRGNELSKEFVEQYPDKAKKMATPDQIKKSKYVWSDIPIYNQMKMGTR